MIRKDFSRAIYDTHQSSIPEAMGNGFRMEISDPREYSRRMEKIDERTQSAKETKDSQMERNLY